MCYQTKITKQKEEIAARFNAEVADLNDYEPMAFCSAFDYPKTPVITNEAPTKVQLFNWGLIPSWAEDDAIKSYTLNARIETLAEKKSFKDVIQNRCLIVADGFYEWQWRNKSGSKKEKYSNIKIIYTNLVNPLVQEVNTLDILKLDGLVDNEKNSLWPDVVAPSSTQVALARTRPIKEGTLFILHVPSVCTCTVRFMILTVQCSSISIAEAVVGNTRMANNALQINFIFFLFVIKEAESLMCPLTVI